MTISPSIQNVKNFPKPKETLLKRGKEKEKGKEKRENFRKERGVFYLEKKNREAAEERKDQKRLAKQYFCRAC